MKLEQASKLLLVSSALIILSIAVVGAQLFWLIKSQSRPELSKPANYVGSLQCRVCHSREYFAWRQTAHSRTLRDSSQNRRAIVGDFSTSGGIRKFSAEEVSYVIGGITVQQYLKKSGDDYIVLPAQYDIENSRWLPLPERIEKRTFFRDCAGCHTTGLNPEQKDFAEPGVGCEACHGPGSNHIIAPLDKKSETIVNSTQLSTHLSAMVCGSCHTQGEALHGEYAYPAGFKPGEQLAEVFHSVENGDRDYFWPSGNAKEPPLQYLDWLKSGHSEAGVGCLNCHTVHAKDNLNPAQTILPADSMCLSCHRQGHTSGLHETGSCISCHMPESIGGLNPGRIKSHTFKPVEPAKGKGFGARFKQSEECFSCHEG
jgi:hypothetical protein